MRKSCRPRGGSLKAAVNSICTCSRHAKRPQLYFGFATFLLFYAFASPAMAVGQRPESTHLYTVGRRIHLQSGSQKDKEMLRNVPSVKFLLTESFEIAYEDLKGDGSTEVILVSTAADFCGSAGCETVVLEKHGATYVILLDQNIPGELATTREQTDGYAALAALDQSGQIAVGNIPGTPAFGHQFVYPMKPPAGSRPTAAGATPGPGGPLVSGSLPSLQLSDLNSASCVGYDFAQSAMYVGDQRSVSQKKECDGRKNLNFVSAIGPSDLDRVVHPLGTPLWGGKEFLKYFECTSAGLSTSAVNEMYFFAALLARKANTTVDRSTCSVIEQSTTAGESQIGSSVVQFFHSADDQKTCFERNYCSSVVVHMAIMGNLGIQDGYTQKYVYMMEHAPHQGIVTMGICTSDEANELRPCNYH